MTMNFIVNPRKEWSQKMAADWLAGCGGGNLVEPTRSGASWTGERIPPGPVAAFGVQPETMALWQEALHQAREFYYIDNAYFSAGHAEDKYMRVTRNAKQCDGRGDAGPERFAAHGIEIKPWRYDGRHVLVTCQSEWWYVQHGTTLRDWCTLTLNELRANTDRPIRIRYKPSVKYRRAPNFMSGNEITGPDIPLDADMADAWAVVTLVSNTAVEAILAGVPAFVTGQDCAAKPMACSDLQFIETPYRPDDREPWAWNLAANQWTPPEIRSGLAWRMLQVDV